MKVDALITRYDFGDQGTFGRWESGPLHYYTGELPPRDNLPGLSCIPEGIFDVEWSMSPRLHKFTYRLKNVPHRDGVLLHAATYMGDEAKGFRCQLKGCVAPGEKVGVMDGQRAILISRPAIRGIEDYFERRPFRLEIRHAS